MNSESLREKYNACLPLLSEYGTEIAQSTALYTAYAEILEKEGSTLDAAQRAVVEHALRDFRLAGVALDGAKKERFKELMLELSRLGAKFEENVLDATNTFSLHVTDEAELAGINATIVAQARERAVKDGKDGWLFGLDQPTYVAIVTDAHSARLRRAYYEAWSTRASDQGPSAGTYDNTPIVEDLLRLRHEAARLLDFPNYAAYALATRMAKSVDEVLAFLRRLAKAARPAAERELAELTAFAGRKLDAWDITYYSERLQQERYSISQEELRPYLPLPRVLDGLFAVIERLFEVKLKRREDVGLWHPDARYYEITDAGGEQIGGFYLDPYARPHKRSGAWMDECIGRKQTSGGKVLPVAYLVCNALPGAEGKPALLTHDDVVTMFHEFGHGLHHLLTRIAWPSVAGINGVAWDAVELPSQFLENYAWHPQVLKELSKHVETGESLPDATIAQLLKTRSYQAGIATLRQVEFALFDFRLHAEYDPAKGGRVREILARGAPRGRGGRDPAVEPLPVQLRPHLRRRLCRGVLQLQVGRGAGRGCVLRVHRGGRVRPRDGAALRGLHPVPRGQPRRARRLRRVPRAAATDRAPAGAARHRLLKKVASWNVNSLRVRLPALTEWLAANPVDVIGLQETKLTDDVFPLADIQALGYHVVRAGQKTYNGVALLSREPLEATCVDFGGGFVDEQRRVIAATSGGVRYINLYVPNGQAVGSEKYAYKLRWLDALQAFLAAELAAHERIVVMGDFNIAPTTATCTTRRRGPARSCAASRSAARSPRCWRSASTTASGCSSSRRRRSAGGTTGRPASAAISACASTSSWPADRWRRSAASRWSTSCRAAPSARRTMPRSSRPLTYRVAATAANRAFGPWIRLGACLDSRKRRGPNRNAQRPPQRLRRHQHGEGQLCALGSRCGAGAVREAVARRQLPSARPRLPRFRARVHRPHARLFRRGHGLSRPAAHARRGARDGPPGHRLRDAPRRHARGVRRRARRHRHPALAVPRHRLPAREGRRGAQRRRVHAQPRVAQREVHGALPADDRLRRVGRPLRRDRALHRLRARRSTR